MAPLVQRFRSSSRAGPLSLHKFLTRPPMTMSKNTSPQASFLPPASHRSASSRKSTLLCNSSSKQRASCSSVACAANFSLKVLQFLRALRESCFLGAAPPAVEEERTWLLAEEGKRPRGDLAGS